MTADEQHQSSMLYFETILYDAVSSELVFSWFANSITKNMDL